jgi:hypothetical protein
VTQFYSRCGARSSDAPASSDELSFDMSSSFIEDVTSSPPVEPSSLEQLVRRSVTEPPQEGVRRQDQLERFSAKREHNQHT